MSDLVKIEVILPIFGNGPKSPNCPKLGNPKVSTSSTRYGSQSQCWSPLITCISSVIYVSCQIRDQLYRLLVFSVSYSLLQHRALAAVISGLGTTSKVLYFHPIQTVWAWYTGMDLSANTIDRFFLWITTFAFSASLIWFCFHLFKVKELVAKVSKRFVKIILISFQAFPFRSCELVSSLTAALFHTFAWVLLLAGFNWWSSLSQPWPYLACADSI